MSNGQIWIAILVAAGVSLLVRVLPLTLIRRKITNRFLRSFLYYVPYATLAVMTFPAIIDAAGNPVAGIAALAVGGVLAWRRAGLVPVALASCGTVFLTEWLMRIG